MRPPLRLVMQPTGVSSGKFELCFPLRLTTYEWTFALLEQLVLTPILGTPLLTPPG